MSGNVVIAVPDPEPIRQGFAEVIGRAKECQVQDAVTHGMAQKLLKDLALAEKGVREKLDPIIKNANTTHKQLTGLRADILAPLDQAKRRIWSILGTYEEAERRRVEAEEKRLAEAEKRQQEEEILEQASEAEAEGNHEAAEEILETPVEKPVVTVDTETAKVKGVASSGRWKAEVEDYPVKSDGLIKMVKYIAAKLDDQPGLIGLLAPNGPALNAMAKAQREALKIPGVRVFKATSRRVTV